MKSIMQKDKYSCYLCGRNGSADQLEKHHVFGGANRNYSEEDGLTVYLCGNRCHRNGIAAAHRSKRTADFLKSEAQILHGNPFMVTVQASQSVTGGIIYRFMR